MQNIGHYDTMSWVILICAGLLEMVWAVGLKYADGFRRPLPSVIVGLAAVASVVLLAFAARTLPIGTAYAIWVGIGALGAVVMGVILFNEPATPARIACLLLLVGSIIGLKICS